MTSWQRAGGEDTLKHVAICESGSFSEFGLWPHLLLFITVVKTVSLINENIKKFGFEQNSMHQHCWCLHKGISALEATELEKVIKTERLLKL